MAVSRTWFLLLAEKVRLREKLSMAQSVDAETSFHPPSNTLLVREGGLLHLNQVLFLHLRNVAVAGVHELGNTGLKAL